MKSHARTRAAKGSALIVCHRWFTSGEGWAWDDGWPDTDLNEALGLLKQELPSLRRPEHLARHRLRHGVLVVRSTDDLECPDPLARPRHPVLIAGVFMPGVHLHDCSPSDEEAMLGQAERQCRELYSPGSKPGLSLAMPAKVANVLRRRNAVKIMGLLALVIIALGVGTETVDAVKTFFGSEVGEKNIQPWVMAVKEPLQRWGAQDVVTQAASVDGDTQSKAVNQFFSLLSRQKGWDRLDGRHVDIDFLRRLPESAAKIESSPKEADVREAMLNLLKGFSAIASEKMQDRAPQEVVASIARQMDYRAWYASEDRKGLFDGRSDPPGEVERQYVSRFCTPAAGGEDGGLSKILHAIMVSQWGIRGLTDDDLRRRPWFVVGCFFEFLAANTALDPGAPQAPRVEGAQPQQNSAAVLERLRRYLPPESVVSRSRLSEDNLERVIRDGLRVLAMNLDIPTSGRDDRSVLEDVRVRLKQVAESTLEVIPERDMAASTRWYLEHLACRNATPQKEIPRK